MIVELVESTLTSPLWMDVLIASALMLVGALLVLVVRGGTEIVRLRRSLAKAVRLLRRHRKLLYSRSTSLRRERQRYEELFMRVPAPVVITEESGTVVAANPALLDLLGLESEAQLKTMNFSRFYVNMSDRAKLLEDLKLSDSDGRSGELEMRRLDGEIRSVLYSLRTIRSSGRRIEYIQGTLTDITRLRESETDRRKLETHLRLSQKLEAVGRLAAGIAHEINTPMQYIGDNVYFLQQSFDDICLLRERQRRLLDDGREMPPSELSRRFADVESELDIEQTVSAVPGALRRVREGVESVNHIVGAMKELAHPGTGAKAAADINALLDTALTVTCNAYKTVAQVETDLGAIPAVLVYKNELTQVFINLVVNAAHAIASSHVSSGLGVIRVCTEAGGGAIKIRISDDGCGIPEVVLDRIFDPFFTTKDVGEGTGQGLAIARATIVEKHGGSITVDSKVGVGTTFTITLPLGEDEADGKLFRKEVG